MVEHFQGKTIPEHLREARLKGANIQREIHGLEAPGYFAAFFDSFKESATFFLIIWTIVWQLHLNHFQMLAIFGTLGIGLIIWKAGRSSILGYARLERLHRLIEEERYEILHHRTQEKEELREMYQAKGFSGNLLEEVIQVLIADENRLLQVMIEEELGLTLEIYEHPLKQGLGAALGVLLASAICMGLFAVLSHIGMILGAALASTLSGIAMAQKEKNRLLNTAIWNLSMTCMTGFITYFTIHFLLQL